MCNNICVLVLFLEKDGHLKWKFKRLFVEKVCTNDIKLAEKKCQEEVNNSKKGFFSVIMSYILYLNIIYRMKCYNKGIYKIYECIFY